MLLARHFGRVQRVKPLLLKSPRLGVFNLKGDSASKTAEEDVSAIASCFSEVVESSTTPPKCEVLFVYCDFTVDGGVVGSAAGLREIIRDSGAYVVVVASENPAENSGAAVKPTGYGQANLVVTLERRGTAFGSFYRRLFDAMANGLSMPVAWVKLAPQIPGHDDPSVPSGYMACELGQIAFGSTLSYEP